MTSPLYRHRLSGATLSHRKCTRVFLPVTNLAGCPDHSLLFVNGFLNWGPSFPVSYDNPCCRDSLSTGVPSSTIPARYLWITKNTDLDSRLAYSKALDLGALPPAPHSLLRVAGCRSGSVSSSAIKPSLEPDPFIDFLSGRLAWASPWPP